MQQGKVQLEKEGVWTCWARTIVMRNGPEKVQIAELNLSRDPVRLPDFLLETDHQFV